MFDKEYSFKGQHAEKVIKLTAKFDEKKSIVQKKFGCLSYGTYCRFFV